MIPRIVKYSNEYRVIGKYGTDIVPDLLTAIRYWFWHCGINPKITFWKWKRN